MLDREQRQAAQRYCFRGSRLMPHIVIYSPRLSREAKVGCAEAVTQAFAAATGLEADLLTIHFEEHSYDSVAVGGKLLTDAYPELAERERQFAEASRSKD